MYGGDSHECRKKMLDENAESKCDDNKMFVSLYLLQDTVLAHEPNFALQRPVIKRNRDHRTGLQIPASGLSLVQMDDHAV